MSDDIRTDSGIPVEALYDESDRSDDLEDALGLPGGFPFTRGIHPGMYRDRLWTMRQYAGYGTARETNARYRYLMERGQTGLSVAFDLPTQMGYDSDHPMAEGEVGRSGVAIDSVEDMRILFEAIDPSAVSTSMTINATAAILLAFYFVVAEEKGVSADKLSGTVQNDILKEYVARGTYVFPVEPSLRLAGDVIAFCATEAPRWNPISISGYHIREAGATAPQEIAFTFVNGMTYVDRALSVGVPLESFAPRLSFFFAAHNDFFEEIAKFRAARRLWARIMREKYGASDRAARLRFHAQTGGSMLTAQQPRNNVARVTIQALSAVLGGTQSLHTNGYDEALSLPSEEAAAIALRTQQIIAYESGVDRTPDPLAGSFFVESLTDRLEEAARAEIGVIEDRGGATRSIGYMQNEIHRSAYRTQRDVESGRRVIVGVNRFAEGDPEPVPASPSFGRLADQQRERLVEFKSRRDSGEVERTLDLLGRAAEGTENLVPGIMEAARAGATVGEIADRLRSVWGEYLAGDAMD